MAVDTSLEERSKLEWANIGYGLSSVQFVKLLVHNTFLFVAISYQAFHLNGLVVCGAGDKRYQELDSEVPYELSELDKYCAQKLIRVKVSCRFQRSINIRTVLRTG